MTVVETHSEEETIRAGADVGRLLRPGSVVACFGELGSGKTRFIQGVCKSLGVNEHVASPTFTIVNEYHVGDTHVCHFDFYRLASTNELREIGFEEYLDGENICLIEWADRVQDSLPPNRYDVHLTLGGEEHTRRITCEEMVETTA
jgi:tRNA threonylcarbamoyladenosine biosynthesis protein TsaE